MAEQTLNEIIVGLMNWIESLHQNNLKYQAQIEELQAKLSVAQQNNHNNISLNNCINNNINNNSSSSNNEVTSNSENDNKTTLTTVPLINNVENHHQIVNNLAPVHSQHAHQQAIYQPLSNHGQMFAPQTMPCVWTPYNPNGHYDMPIQYHDQGYSIHPYQQQQHLQQQQQP